jgi:pimeloyl-ACP methyl ester carboxylesterase
MNGATPVEKVFSADGTAIAYEKWGAGPPLVLVSGALGDRMSSAPLAELLRGDFTVYAHDRRGRGSSGDTAPYAVEREIEDLAALIGAAGGSAAVYGISSGAILTLEAAARGLPITRAAVYEPPYVVGGDRIPLTPDLAARLSALVSSGARGDAVALFMTEAVEIPADMVGQLRDTPFWPRLEELAHTLPYDIAIADEGRLPVERLAGIGIPVLAMDGTISPQWARNSVQAVADAVQAGRRVSLEGQNHDVRPVVLAPVLLEFFAG